MTLSPKSPLVIGLRDLYNSNDAARRLLDGFAGRQKDIRMTPASRAAVLADASHGEIVAIFRKLDELGAGNFMVGRRGSKTRMEWQYSVRGLGAAAQGAAIQPEVIDPDQLEEGEADPAGSDTQEVESGESEWIAHTFQLRPDVRLTIKLPVDLTTKEAERIAGFIRQVPFNE